MTASLPKKKESEKRKINQEENANNTNIKFKRIFLNKINPLSSSSEKKDQLDLPKDEIAIKEEINSLRSPFYEGVSKQLESQASTTVPTSAPSLDGFTDSSILSITERNSTEGNLTSFSGDGAKMKATEANEITNSILREENVTELSVMEANPDFSSSPLDSQDSCNDSILFEDYNSYSYTPPSFPHGPSYPYLPQGFYPFTQPSFDHIPRNPQAPFNYLPLFYPPPFFPALVCVIT